jgi:biopolymer transport protein ExbD
MASGGDARDNPVAINVVPMVDVLFCLCLFFMCSMKFEQAEGKFDAWLPRDRGTTSAPAPDEPAARIALFFDAGNSSLGTKSSLWMKASLVQFGHRVVRDEAELETLLREAHADARAQKHPEAPAILDADGRVPWGDVVAVVNLCRRSGIQDVRFALSAGK